MLVHLYKAHLHCQRVRHDVHVQTSWNGTHANSILVQVRTPGILDLDLDQGTILGRACDEKEDRRTGFWKDWKQGRLMHFGVHAESSNE